MEGKQRSFTLVFGNESNMVAGEVVLRVSFDGMGVLHCESLLYLHEAIGVAVNKYQYALSPFFTVAFSSSLP
eukprot:m.128229 g.128229  ORF g.128229 m.128229 type:complete len:72 (-) comp17424_c1_seq4:113-328(-)